MKTVILTTLSLFLLAVAGAVAFVYSGVFNVAADEPHSTVVHAVLETARVRSIKAQAAGIVVPGGFDEEAKIISAAGHFSEHCVTCHGAPGAKAGETAQGMYPKPPDLTHVSERFRPAELFWIIKHGLKMSGMPSMAHDGDAMLWSTVAFLQRLPHMSGEDYNGLWMKAQAQNGEGHNMGGMNMHGAGATDAEKH